MEKLSKKEMIDLFRNFLRANQLTKKWEDFLKANFNKQRLKRWKKQPK